MFALVTLTAVNKVVDTSSLRNLNISSYSLSSWNGQPCYFVSGSGSADINGALVNQTGFVPSNFTFDTCVSAQYDVPLEFNAVANLTPLLIFFQHALITFLPASMQNACSAYPNPTYPCLVLPRGPWEWHQIIYLPYSIFSRLVCHYHINMDSRQAP